MWASCYIEQIQVNAGATGPSWLGPAASSIPLHWLTLKETRCIPHCYSFLSYLWGSCCLPLLLWPGRASVLSAWVFRREDALLTALEEENNQVLPHPQPPSMRVTLSDVSGALWPGQGLARVFQHEGLCA